jgi:hypothetical protein
LSRISDKLGYEPIDDDFLDAHLFNVDVIHPEYADIIHYLDKGIFPEAYSEKQKQRLVYRAEPYTLISGLLYKQGKDGILRRCINPSEIPSILKDCHGDCCGGHFSGFVTAHKALQFGYWWPTYLKMQLFMLKNVIHVKG